ncbi:MAG TPA: hypothetical protein VLW83_14025 [Candidatus Acidoferrales bacterium]|nr:hypothetical protein [Candidatus Acidoferrales bacterium]
MTANWTVLDDDEPLWTPIRTYSGDATSVDEIVAVSSPLLMKLVETGFPFQVTDDEEVKFDPFTVSVKSLLPATSLVGESDVIAGVGLLGDTGGVITLFPPPHPANASITPTSRIAPTKLFPCIGCMALSRFT